jgi:vesicle coat complex subunit
MQMNYAKSQPDMAIMAVNTFVKDCEDPNPLIRALAVRTMGCIRVDKVSSTTISGYSSSVYPIRLL